MNKYKHIQEEIMSGNLQVNVFFLFNNLKNQKFVC